MVRERLTLHAKTKVSDDIVPSGGPKEFAQSTNHAALLVLFELPNVGSMVTPDSEAKLIVIDVGISEFGEGTGGWDTVVADVEVYTDVDLATIVVSLVH